MVTGFDRIVVGVPDVVAAASEYQQLLGVEPLIHSDRAADSPVAWLCLGNTVIELVPTAAERPMIQGVVFCEPAAEFMAVPVTNALGLDLRLCNGSATEDYRRRGSAEQGEPWLVDHLVLHTLDADRCIQLFSEHLGIRLALDKTVPEWGGRMLFFRAGKLTLEVIESTRGKIAADSFWGVAYQCPDIEEASRQLAGRGVELSAIREGRKVGTRVATIKSHCLGIPSLLIEPAA